MFNTLFYKPLYNALVFLSSIIPGHDIGLAIIVLTLLVKVVLLPLYHKVLVTQKNLKKIEPELKQIQAKYKDNREELARQMMELYRKYKVNPFMSFVIILIQFPIIIALFLVFRGDFVFDPNLLYSFVHIPATISTNLFGLVDVTTKSFSLALLTGFTQFIQMKYSLPSLPAKNATESSFKDDFSRSMHLNMKYVMPVFIAYFAYTLSSAISLYWITSNLFGIGQEIFVKRKMKEEEGKK